MFIVSLQVIEQGMFLVTSITDHSLVDGSYGIDKGPFGTLAVCEVNFRWDTVVQIKTQVDFGLFRTLVDGRIIRP